MNKNLRTGLSALIIAGVASMTIGTDGCGNPLTGLGNKIEESFYVPEQSSQNTNDWPVQYMPYNLFME